MSSFVSILNRFEAEGDPNPYGSTDGSLCDEEQDKHVRGTANMPSAGGPVG